MRLLRSKKGMTLVEMMVSMVMVLLATGTLTALIQGSITGWCSGNSEDSATTQGTMVLQKLCNDIRDGKSAVGSSGTLAVTFPAKLTDIGTQETVYNSSADDPVKRYYSVSHGNLIRNVGGVITVLGSGISSPVFGANGGVVTITLTCTQQIGSKTTIKVVTGSVIMRNYKT